MRMRRWCWRKVCLVGTLALLAGIAGAGSEALAVIAIIRGDVRGGWFHAGWDIEEPRTGLVGSANMWGFERARGASWGNDSGSPVAAVGGFRSNEALTYIDSFFGADTVPRDALEGGFWGWHGASPRHGLRFAAQIPVLSRSFRQDEGSGVWTQAPAVADLDLQLQTAGRPDRGTYKGCSNNLWWEACARLRGIFTDEVAGQGGITLRAGESVTPYVGPDWPVSEGALGRADEGSAVFRVTFPAVQRE